MQIFLDNYFLSKQKNKKWIQNITINSDEADEMLPPIFLDVLSSVS